ALMQMNLDSNKVNLLFFGLVREYKGLDLLFEALSDERLKSLPINLVVAGEFYDSYSKYEEMVKKLGLENIVIMENKFIENNDVAKYFCACDLVVLPYKTATQSGVTQIAYHFSKPMLVTNVGGLPEIVSDGKSGYVCEPNAKSIADCLIDFCQNKRDFSETLEIEKQRFGWDKMTAAIRELKTKKDNSNDNKK
ncbi:MAG: glycosyltransferase, partial [Bacteroidales bacterium]|nr:glycosyltransferase [Bacteroidales bacterium]